MVEWNWWTGLQSPETQPQQRVVFGPRDNPLFKQPLTVPGAKITRKRLYSKYKTY